MTNQVLQLPLTTIWFVPAAAAQAEDYAFEFHNLAAAAGRQSAHWDRGHAARPWAYEWRGFLQFADVPVLTETVDFYLKWSGTSASATAHPDNDDGTGESAVSALAKVSNLKYLGSVVVDEAAANVEMSASGIVVVGSRGVNVVVWNASADALANDVDECGFYMTPLPDQIQNTV